MPPAVTAQLAERLWNIGDIVKRIEDAAALQAVPVYEVVTGGAGVLESFPLDAATAMPTTTATPSTI
jgi:hypothetical protein